MSRRLERAKDRRQDEQILIAGVLCEVGQGLTDIAGALVHTQTRFVGIPLPEGIRIYPSTDAPVQSLLFSALNHQRHVTEQLSEQLSKLTRPDSNSSNSLSSLDISVAIESPHIDQTKSAPVAIPSRSNRNQSSSVHKGSY